MDRKTHAGFVALCLTLLCWMAVPSDALAQYAPEAVSLNYRPAWHSEGDVLGRSFRATASWHAASTWTGIEVSLAFRKAGPSNITLEAAVRSNSNWSNLHTYVADVSVFADIFRFNTGALGHQMRVHLGPSVQVRRGEKAYWLIGPAGFEEFPQASQEMIDTYEYDHIYHERLHDGDLPNGEYALLSNDRRGTDLGGVLALSYGFEYKRVFVEAAVSTHMYLNAHKVYSYGLGVGYRF